MQFSPQFWNTSGNFTEKCRKLTFAGEKLQVSAVQSGITSLLSISSVAAQLRYSCRNENEQHSHFWRKYFAAKKT